MFMSIWVTTEGFGRRVLIDGLLTGGVVEAVRKAFGDVLGGATAEEGRRLFLLANQVTWRGG